MSAADITAVFNECQVSSVSHQRLVLQLSALCQSIYANGEGAVFFETLLDHLARVLDTKKSSPAADRVCEFITAFCTHIAPDDTQEDLDKDSENVLNIIEGVLKMLLRGFVAKSSTVRGRAGSLIVKILPAAAISEELWEDIGQAALERTNDRSVSVRTQAAFILSRYAQEDEVMDSDSIVSKARDRVCELMEYDASAEVRRAALLNVLATPENRARIMHRARDTNALNRRTVFSRAVPRLGDFRQFEFEDREQLLRSGLRDRDSKVKQAATHLLTTRWLKQVDFNILDLLAWLDVLNSTVAELVLVALFDTRDPALLDMMQFPPEYWSSLTPESVFLARCLNSYCAKNPDLSELGDRIPELSKLAGYITQYWEAYCEQESGTPEQAESEFIVEQLLVLVHNSDFGDEEGRNHIKFAVTNVMLGTTTLPSEAVMSKIMLVYHKLSPSSTDFIAKVVELATDVQDQLLDSDSSAENVIAGLLTGLILFESSLRLVTEPLDDRQSLGTMYKEWIEKALAAPEPSLHEHGIKCLGLISLLDRQMSSWVVPKLLKQHQAIVEEGGVEQDAARRLILEALCDNLLCYGLESIGDSSGNLPRELLSVFVDGLHNTDDQELPALACLCLCKLILANIACDTDLVKDLMCVFIGPQTSGDSVLQQNLSFFFPVYTATSTRNKEIVASLALPVLEKVEAMDVAEEINYKFEPMLFVRQVLEWTHPSRCASDVVPSEACHAHVVFANCLLESNFQKPVLEGHRRFLTNALCTQFCFEGIGAEDSDLLEKSAAGFNLPLDTVCRRYFDRFVAMLNARKPDQVNGEPSQQQEQQQEGPGCREREDSEIGFGGSGEPKIHPDPQPETGPDEMDID